MTSFSRSEGTAGLARLAGRPGLWPLALAATVELLRARRRLDRVRAAEFDPDAGPESMATRAETLPQVALDIGWLLPRIAARMPFRADCLVQTMAGHALLARRGLEGRIHVGARGSAAGFEAHAWLTHGGAVVIGGEIGDYAPLARREVSGDGP